MANDGTVDQQQLQETLNEAYRIAGEWVGRILALSEVTKDGQLGELAIYQTIEAAINGGRLGNAGNVRNSLGLSAAATRDITGGSGNLMAEGAWGFGGPSGSVDDDFGQDFNTQVNRTLIGATTGTWQNGPLGNSGHTGVLFQMYRSFNNQTVQKWYQYGTNIYREYTRVVNPGTAFGPWYRSGDLEVGSNGNGTFFRFNSGLLICTYKQTISVTTDDWATLNSSSSFVFKNCTWNYPATFSEIPTLAMTPSYFAWTRGTTAIGTSSGRLDLVRESASSTSLDISWTAIGKW